MVVKKAQHILCRDDTAAFTIVLILKIGEQNIALQLVFYLVKSGMIASFCGFPGNEKLLTLGVRCIAECSDWKDGQDEQQRRQTHKLPRCAGMGYACFNLTMYSQFFNLIREPWQSENQFMQRQPVRQVKLKFFLSEHQNRHDLA